MNDHIVKSYDEELRRLTDSIAQMAGKAESQLARALEALANHDVSLARAVIAEDGEVDSLERYANEQAMRLLALRSPLADDLRVVLACLKVASEIERVADHAKSAAKRVLAMAHGENGPLKSLLRMGHPVQDLLSGSVNAFLARDGQLARKVWEDDKEIDGAYASLFREILTYMMEDPRTITAGTHLLFVAKNLERIGDHATNIAEITHYLVTGSNLNDDRPKQDGIQV